MTAPVLAGPQLVPSGDGTPIAYWYGGAGQPLLLVQALPSWPSRVATAHTLPREMSQALSWEPEEGRRVAVPTLLILGADSPDFVRRGVRRVDDALPDSRVVVLEGQQHVADQLIPEEFAQIVLGFLEPGEDGSVD